MPKARLQRAVTDASAGGANAEFAGADAASGVAPLALAIALLAACLYAAFAHGAAASADEERLQLALAVIALAAAVVWSRRGLSLRAPRRVWLALGLLAAFAFWSGVTVLWSVAPDRTWTECNRVMAYVLVLVLAIALGASLKRSLARIAEGLLLVSLAVALSALAQKLVPGLRVSGLFSLDQTGTLPRLQEPLGYWNALALIVAFGVPSALAIVIDQRRATVLRLAAAAAATTMIVTIGFTYSRGGVLALVAALTIFAVVSGSWLPCLEWLGVLVAGALPVLVVGLNSRPLTATGVALSTRETAGAELLVLLAASLALMLAAAHWLIGIERRRPRSPGQSRRVGRGLLGAAAAAIAVAILAVAISHRGLAGTVSHAWSSFTATRTTSVTNPGRLLLADSENRWVWWKEAARAFGDRPIQGWGAGSFAVVHLLYRRDTLPVQQPHSLPLQLLSETGLVGAGLGLGSLVLLLAAGVAAVRGRDARSTGPAAAALLAVGTAFCVHALYDWDWDIPAVTLPALIALGVVGASAAAPGRGAVDPATSARGRVGRLAGPRRPVLAGVALTAISLAAFAVSVAVPRIAATDAARALVEASTGTPAALDLALADARRATHLDPLSDAGLRAVATIALHRGDLSAARSALLAAVARQPSDEQAWQDLALTDVARRDTAEAAAAARRVAAIDPRGVSRLNRPARQPR